MGRSAQRDQRLEIEAVKRILADKSGVGVSAAEISRESDVSAVMVGRYLSAMQRSGLAQCRWPKSGRPLWAIAEEGKEENELEEYLGRRGTWVNARDISGDLGISAQSTGRKLSKLVEGGKALSKIWHGVRMYAPLPQPVGGSRGYLGYTAPRV